jgi:hypothetical protein
LNVHLIQRVAVTGHPLTGTLAAREREALLETFRETTLGFV